MYRLNCITIARLRLLIAGWVMPICVAMSVSVRSLRKSCSTSQRSCAERKAYAHFCRRRVIVLVSTLCYAKAKRAHGMMILVTQVPIALALPQDRRNTETAARVAVTVPPILGAKIR